MGTTTTQEQMIALGDQVQAVVRASGVPVYGFVLMTVGGLTEYRSALDKELFKRVLTAVAEAF